MTARVSPTCSGRQRAADAKGLTLTFSAPPEARRVDADHGAASDLANLVENAVRHTSRSGVWCADARPAASAG